MVRFLIDNNTISISVKLNNGYFRDKGIIPINLGYKLQKIPYYENSRHFFREFNLFDTSTYLKQNKPIKNSKRISNLYYNPKKTKGKIINYEYIPTKIEKYNNVPKNLYIESIHIWSNKGNLNQLINPVYLKTNIDDKDILTINMILVDIKKTKIGFHYYLLSKIKKPINNCKFIDINSLISTFNEPILNICLK